MLRTEFITEWADAHRLMEPHDPHKAVPVGTEGAIDYVISDDEDDDDDDDAADNGDGGDDGVDGDLGGLSGLGVPSLSLRHI